MNIKIGFLIALIAILSGCVTPQYNYTPRSVANSEPPLGSTNIAYIGEILLRQGEHVEYDSIYLRSNVKAGWAYTMLPGYYTKQGEGADTEFFQPGKGENTGKIVKAALADSWKSIMAYKNKNGLCIVTVFNVRVCNDKAKYERKKMNITKENSFQQTLIYTGKVGKKVNISYREFSNKQARPAFNTNVEYDLSESTIIGYKGARIQIIKATNQYIRYKVLKNFNASKF